MSWETAKRPATPQRGRLTDTYVSAKGNKVKFKDGDNGGPVGLRFCEASAKGSCDASPKAKGSPRVAPSSSYTSSTFTMARKKATGAYISVCHPGMEKGPDGKKSVEKVWDTKRCKAEVGYRNGRRVMRFCVNKNQPGHVIDVTDDGPAEVRKKAQEACAAWRKRGSYEGTDVGSAELGGLRKRKGAKRRKARQ